ncbi:MAG TPA: alpha-(1-_3)-arabinofuranosyltransferase family protein [Acidimicrobiales bacterium]|nr:alpha-(1->3)-arabinofuranosyltransferase family protein [Acidimicrobiales bacterium]
MTRRGSIAAHVLLAVLTYVPILRSRPGIVGADTKSYLYLDPSKLLSRAAFMWDPDVGMGTLTHQTIGYLFPMGPWYWVLDELSAADWVAQRLWLATVIFAAGAGVLFLGRTLAWRGSAIVVAALAYMLSPYLLDYSARISVILLPWAALPWMVGLTDRALRRGGWRHPALFALVVLCVGGVNATALVFAGLGPVLWIGFAWRDVGIGRASATALRIGGLTALLSVWWVIGLAVQGGYGIPILRYTETIETVARTSLSSEVLRGLGYWFFYGNDKLGPWIEPAVQYTQQVWLILVGFAVPCLALAGAAVLRWRHRAYAISLVVVGTVIAVGAHPYDDPPPLGAAFKALASTSTVGLALRSTPRAVPLVALGMALLLGASLTALARRFPVAGAVASLAASALVLAGLPPLFSGDLAVGEHISRPELLPPYWQEAADHLDAAGDSTRVLELPGADFASYRWGNTIDPITPYLMDRPYVARELIPYGTPGTPDLLNAFDRRLQEGVFEPSALAPIARLMRAGDVVLRNDLLFERYRTPRPRVLLDQLTPRPEGVGEPTAFGPPSATHPAGPVPRVDELELAVAAAIADPPPVVDFPIHSVPRIVGAAPAGRSLLVAGDGEGLVDLAAAGLLDGAGPIRYAASLTSTSAWDSALSDSGQLVLTDTNRKRARRWGTVRENTGYTEPADHAPLRDDPTDARLEVFPKQTTADQTVVQLRGVRAVRATRYGNPVSYTPEDRPANALDGDVSTAWRVGAFADVAGERLRVDLTAPVEASAVTIVQPLTGPRNRVITKVTLRFDGGHPVDVDLGPASLTAAGQQVTFASRRFRSIEVEVLETNVGRRPKYDGQSGVGIAELRVGDVHVDEVVRLPTDLLARAGARAAAHPLSVVLTRQRSNPADPARTDEEPSLVRTFELTSPRPFVLEGSARLAATTADDAIDRFLGVTGPIARSDARLPGDLDARASAAIDGDPGTAWSPGLLDQVGHWLEVESPTSQTYDHLDLQVVADGRHSVPKRIRIEVDDEDARFVELPAIADDASRRGATATVSATFEPVTGRRVRVTIEDVRRVTTPDFFSGDPLDLPVAIAELGLPNLRVSAPSPTTALDLPCRDDLVTVDGRPFPVRLRGEVLAAASRSPLRIEACGVSGGLDLAVGDHEVRTAHGTATGIDVDRLVLRSEPTTAATTASVPADPPRLGVETVGRTGFDVAVAAGGRQPFWLVLGQSHSVGWHATVAGKDLGPPALVDGYANAWRIDANGEALEVRLRWTPQERVWVGLAVSATGLLFCLLLLLVSFLRSGTRPLGRSRRDPVVRSALGERCRAPELAPPPRPHPWAPLVVLVVFGSAAGPVVGTVAAAVTLLAVVVVAARWLVALGAAATLAAAGAYVAFQQHRYGYPPDFAWPVNVERAADLAWVGVALLAGSALNHAERAPAIAIEP